MLCVRPAYITTTTTSSSSTPDATAVTAATTNTISASAATITFTSTTRKLHAFCTVRTVDDISLLLSQVKTRNMSVKRIFKASNRVTTCSYFSFVVQDPFVPHISAWVARIMPKYEIFVYTYYATWIRVQSSRRYKVFVACLQFIKIDGNGSRTAVKKLYQYIHTEGSFLYCL